MRVEVYLLYEATLLRQPQLITEINDKDMKRIYRNDMSPVQKEKIAAQNRGKKLSPQTKAKISKALSKYWDSLPYKPSSSGNTSLGGAFEENN